MSAEHAIAIEEAVHREDFRAIERLQAQTWSDSSVLVMAHIIALVDAGGMVLVARGTGKEIAGFCLGFPAFDGQTVWLWSHMAAVDPSFRGKGVGAALKHAQRQAAKARGYPAVTWTYDPLEAGNAHFNLVKLGALARTFLPNHYGEMDDPLNKGLPSDRLVAEWWTDAPRLPLPAGPRHPWLSVALTASGLQEPHWSPGRALSPSESAPASHLSLRPWPQANLGNGLVYEVEIPLDFQALKANDHSLALAWRQATGKAFTELFQRGGVVLAFERYPDSGIGCYLIGGVN